jgi:hypothetical protein
MVRGVYDESGETANTFNYKYSYCEKNQWPEKSDIIR